MIISIVIKVNCTDFAEFNKNLFYIRNFDFLSIINETVYWSQDRHCLQKFHSINNGLKRSEEWALQSKRKTNFYILLRFILFSFLWVHCSAVDAWGKIPSGILNQNFFDSGSFSECFHIVRNGRNYKTRYCIAQLTIQSTAERQKHSNNIPFWSIFDVSRTGPSISVGICLPAACSVEQLGNDINRVVHRQLPGMIIQIRKDYCQSEEFPSKLEILDFVAM